MNILKAIMRAIVRTAIFIYCKIVYRVKIIGKGNIPKKGAIIFCGNHRSYLDAPLMVATAGRHMYFMGKEELRKVPIFRFLGAVFGVIFVKRDAKDITSLKISLKHLKNGECIALFPEGTRNGMAKGVKPKDGAIKLAIKANVPIVPVGVQGNFKPFRKIKVNIGKPIYYSKYKDEVNNKEVMDKLTEELMKTIVKLRDERI